MRIAFNFCNQWRLVAACLLVAARLLNFREMSCLAYLKKKTRKTKKKTTKNAVNVSRQYLEARQIKKTI
jgi:uncharacterized membrane protein YqjE